MVGGLPCIAGGAPPVERTKESGEPHKEPKAASLCCCGDAWGSSKRGSREGDSARNEGKGYEVLRTTEISGNEVQHVAEMSVSVWFSSSVCHGTRKRGVEPVRILTLEMTDFQRKRRRASTHHVLPWSCHKFYPAQFAFQTLPKVFFFTKNSSNYGPAIHS